MDPLRRQITDPSLKGLAGLIDEFAKQGPDIPLTVIRAFLYIAMRDGCHMQALEEDLKMGTASGSRNTDWLSLWKRDRTRGFGLIIKFKDPANRRRSMLRLSVKGKKLVTRIKDEFNLC